MRRSKASTCTELPSDDNYEELPALPAYIDTWVSDVVSPEREPDLYDATVAYILGLMLEWGEDGSRLFEDYAPYVAGFVDGRHKSETQPARPSVPTPQPEGEAPDSKPRPLGSFAKYRRPTVSSLLPDE